MDSPDTTQLRAEIERLRTAKRRWMALADERAIEVGALKVEVERLREALVEAQANASHRY
jgi:hypothetical protein